MIGQTDEPTVDPELAEACGSSPSWFCEQVFDWTDGNQGLTQAVDWLIGRPLQIIAICLVASVLSLVSRRYFSRVVHRVIARRSAYTTEQLERLGLDVTPDDEYGASIRREARATSITAVISSTATVIIWSVAIMLILQVLGVSLGPLIASAGIAGVALGFGAQSLVKDCISGLFMLLEDQFGIGDSVDLGEATGIVEAVSLRATVLRGADGTVWHVPNGEVVRVGNRSQLWSMAVVDVSVAYGADLDLATSSIQLAATAVCEHPDWAADVLEPPTVLGVETMGPEGATIRLNVKTAPGSQWALQRALREQIKLELERAGVPAPLPRGMVWPTGEP